MRWGANFARLQKQGDVEVLASWTNPVTGRPAAISDEQLNQLAREFLPIEVAGDPVEYVINKTLKGWVIELINNRGVSKKPRLLATVDAGAVARVNVKPGFKWATARNWKSGAEYKKGDTIPVEIGPGGTEYVAFELQ